MKLSLNGVTALRILRDLRKRGRLAGALRCDPETPDPEPHKRWKAAYVPLGPLLLKEPPTAARPIDVAVPKAADRLRAKFARNTIYGATLPSNAFVSIGDGISISSPEFLFVEMATRMPEAAHVLLGYELCGAFSRDAEDPRFGDVTFDIAPATSVQKIGEVIDRCRSMTGNSVAREHLSYVADNAWSPMEAVLAVLLSMPVGQSAYGLGRVALNVRHQTSPELVALGCPESRVPDIELVDLPLGFNYDGRWHLGLQEIAAADGDADRCAAEEKVRKKYVDDLRRNRELAAMGKVVFPVCAEDMFDEGGLDAVVLEALDYLASRGVEVSPEVRRSLKTPMLRSARQGLVWSLLPWSAAPRYARERENWMRGKTWSVSL